MTSLRFLRRCLGDRRGATAIEYALLAALIAGVGVAAAGTSGRSLARLYAGTDSAVQAAITGSPPP